MVRFWLSETRYYSAAISVDLFGATGLIRTWGGIDTRRGGQKIEVVASQEEARRRLEEIGKTRKQHGYTEAAETLGETPNMSGRPPNAQGQVAIAEGAKVVAACSPLRRLPRRA